MNLAGKNDKGELEEILTKGLRPVTAPDGLWERVWPPRTTANLSAKGTIPGSRAGASRSAVLLWATAAVAAAAVIAIAVIPGAKSNQRLLRSSDVVEIKTWVKDSTGMDLPLANTLPANYQILEARAVNGKAEILLRIGGRETVLTASRALAHNTTTMEHARGAGQTAWSARGLNYQVSNAALAGETCHLCHGQI